MNSDTADVASRDSASTPDSETGLLTYRAPAAVTAIRGRSVFLAGSIQGGPDPWQAQVARRLRGPATVFDPRRDDWDASWVQRASDGRFAAQTAWELDQQARADVVAFYLDPATEAPVSLLELGLAVRRPGKDVVVCCPDGFERKGNVEIVCERMKVPLVETLERLVQWIEEKLQQR